MYTGVILGLYCLYWVYIVYTLSGSLYWVYTVYTGCILGLYFEWEFILGLSWVYIV